MLKCEILVGGVCSGKTTYRHKKVFTLPKEGDPRWSSVSRDDIREQINGKKNMFVPKNEDLVTKRFWERFSQLTSGEYKSNIIVDNTNVSPKYIQQILNNLPEDYDWELVWFDVSLGKAYRRNILRWMRTGIWIPMKVIRKFYRQYNLFKRQYEDNFFDWWKEIKKV